MNKPRRAWLLLLLLGLAPGVHAACSISTTNVAFGSYDPFSSTPTVSTGSLDVKCPGGGLTAFTITLSTGSGTYAARAMTSGSHQLLYNLYLDASYVTIWGDGTAGTGTLQDSTNKNTYTIYGRIPALQNAWVGSYSDTIVVTITY